jgi:hypothetical protein
MILYDYCIRIRAYDNLVHAPRHRTIARHHPSPEIGMSMTIASPAALPRTKRDM